MAVEVPVTNQADISITADDFNKGGASRVAEYWEFIAQNSDIVGESSRAPGLKAPLGMLINMCPVEVTDDNVEMYFTEAQSFVARAQIESFEEEQDLNDEADDELQPDSVKEEVPAKTEVSKKDTVKEKPEKSARTIEDVAETNVASSIPAPDLPARAAKQATADKYNVIEQETPAAPEPAPTAGQETPTLTGAKQPSSAAQKARPATEASPAYQVAAAQPVQISSELALEPVEDRAAPPRYEQTVDYIDAQAEAESEVEFPADAAVVSQEVADEPLEIPAFEPALDFLEEPLEPFNEIGTIEPPDRLFLDSDPQFHPSVTESDQPIEAAEFNPPVEVLEAALVQLADKLESDDFESTEPIRQTLDEIVLQIEIINKLTAAGEDDLKIETAENIEETEKLGEAEEELAELFKQLFKAAQIDIEPEFMEEFSRLALKPEVYELILRAKRDQLPDIAKTGTHEAVRQLLAAISTIKQALLRAARLGRSALALYSQAATA